MNLYIISTIAGIISAILLVVGLTHYYVFGYSVIDDYIIGTIGVIMYPFALLFWIRIVKNFS
jgi:hypothetical protein